MLPHRRRFPRLSFLVAVLLIGSLLISSLASIRQADAAVQQVVIGFPGTQNLSELTTGEVFTFQISYSCSSTQEDCNNVTISYDFPTGIEYLGFDSPAGLTLNDPTEAINGSTTTETWDIGFVKGGDTIQDVLEVRARIVNDGTVGDNTDFDQSVRANSDGSTEVREDFTVTSDASNTAYTASKAVTSGAVYVKDGTGVSIVAQVTYTIEVCQPAGSNLGGQNLTNITIVDTLNSEAGFLSATNGGTESGGTVTWSGLSLNTGSGTACTDVSVTVEYPANSFNLGNSIVNNATVGGENIDGPITQISVSETVTAERAPPPDPDARIRKRVNQPQVDVDGSEITYDLRANNDGNVLLDNFVVTDTIPSALRVTTINVRVDSGGLPTVSYTTSDSNTGTLTGLSNGNNAVAVSGLGLVAGEYITQLTWDYGDGIGVDFDTGWNIGFKATVAPGTPEGTIPNVGEVGYSYDGTAYGPKNATRNVNVIGPRPRPRVAKAVRGTPSPNPPRAGSTIRYRLTLSNPAYTVNPGTELQNPVLADLLDANVTYLGNVNVGGSVASPPTPVETVVSIDHRGTGRTLVQFAWQDASAFDLPADENVWVEFDVQVNDPPSAPDATINNQGSLVGWDNTAIDTGGFVNDTNDLDDDGSTTDTRRESDNVAVQLVPLQARPTLNKEIVSPPTPAAPQNGDTVRYRLTLTNDTQNGTALENPVLADLLSDTLEYEALVSTSGPAGVPDPIIETVPNFNGTRTLIRFRWDGAAAYSLPASESIEVEFDVRVRIAAEPGNIANTVRLIAWDNSNYPTDYIDLSQLDEQTVTEDWDGDGTGNETHGAWDDQETFSLSSRARLTSEKYVRGQLDTVFHRYPDYGYTLPGGTIEYRIRITNEGNVAVRDVTMVDILPYIGDTGVVAIGETRNTGWQPQFTELLSVPAGVVVEYSTSQNPCRPELGISTSCDPPNWSVIPPADSTNVHSFRISFGAIPLNPGDSFDIEWLMHAPIDAPTGAPLPTFDDAGGEKPPEPPDPLAERIAWNSFGYTGVRIDTDGQLLPAEPRKVGIAVLPTTSGQAAYGNYVWIDDNADGIQNEPASNGVNLVRVALYTPGNDGLPGTSDDILIRETVTANDTNGNPGYYLFADLEPGDYYARFYPPTTFDVTTVNQGTAETDSDVIFDNGIHRTAATSLAASEEDLTWDLGLVRRPTASLGNYVWFDANNDGRQNDGSSNGINGVNVRLFASSGTELASTTTDFDAFGQPGYYVFENLDPDVTYYVEFDLPTGATGFTTPNASGVPDELDSDADTTLSGDSNIGRTTDIDLAPGEYDPTWDAGIILPTGSYSLGNLVWRDDGTGTGGVANDGQVNGDEAGINGVDVDLYRDNDNDGTLSPGDSFLRTTTTASVGGVPGIYRFNNLPAGEYVVQIRPRNFTGSGALFGLYSSTGAANAFEPAPDPDDDRNNDDNGTAVPDQGVLSAAVTLGGSPPEPTDDGDIDTTSNLSIDFGFTELLSLGNLVWDDRNNNGVVDTGEPGIDGVTVNLYYDADTSGDLNGTEDTTPVASTVTANGGYYLFDSLAAGTYLVELAESNFQPGNPLEHYRSSTGGSSEPAPNADSDADDSDDNGSEAGALGQAGGVIRSSLVSLELGNEPQDETDLGGDGTGQALNENSNLTVDFGVYTFRLGNLVWVDTNNNGVVDSGETGIPNVAVELFDSSGNALGSTTTDANGTYAFTNLPAGDYYVVLPESNFTSGPLANYRSSNAATYEPAADPDNNTDQDDNGSEVGTLGQAGGFIQSGVITLGPTTDEPDTGIDGDSRNGNQTVDFGVYPALSLGNLVWADLDNDGQFASATESPIPGVTLRLWLDDGDATFDPATDTALGTTTTDANGTYQFSGLAAGTYVVEIVSSNFTPGNALAGYASSSAAGYEPAPATVDDTNETDSGTMGADYIASGMVVLEADSEPDTGSDGDDRNGNQTVDFGVYPTLSLGNLVWADTNNNGVVDNGETGIANVTMHLLDGTGVPVLNADGTPMTTRTDANGYYLFDGLLPGDYIVDVAADNFTTGGALVAYFSSTGGGSEPAPDPDSDADDSDDNGTTAVDTVRSAPITLAWDSEPTADDEAGSGQGSATDENSNLTVDFGFYQVAALGDYVWLDQDRNGVQDTNERGIEGVAVSLLDGTGTPVLNADGTPMTTSTDANGYYLFDNLLPGEYIVAFTIPTGYIFTDQDADTDDAADSDADPTTGRTPLITLSANEVDLDWDAGIYLEGSAAIDLEKTATAERITPRQIAVFELNITNTSDDVTFDLVRVNDTLPDGLSYRASSAGTMAPTVSGQELLWPDVTNGAGLAPGESVFVSYEAEVTTDIGTYRNVATAIATYPGNTATDTDDASLIVADPSVAVNKEIVAPGVDEQGQITFLITLENTGPSTLDTIPLFDTFTGPISYVGGSPRADLIDNAAGSLAWTDVSESLGNLAPGESFQIETIFELNDTASEGSVINNTARVPSATDTLGSTTNDSTDVASMPLYPSAIELLSFTASREAQGVRITWATGAEIDTWGFTLLRSADGSREHAERITPEIILGVGSTTEGATYSWLDTSADPGVSSTYWLEEIELDGTLHEYGPATWQSTLQADNQVYLPLIMR